MNPMGYGIKNNQQSIKDRLQRARKRWNRNIAQHGFHSRIGMVACASSGRSDVVLSAESDSIVLNHRITCIYL